MNKPLVVLFIMCVYYSSGLLRGTEDLLQLFPNLKDEDLHFLKNLTQALKYNKPIAKTSRSFKKEYDYVIVGGGTAGSIMASRLSQKFCVSVLLLEAGGDPLLLSEIPGFTIPLHGKKNDWMYKTIPQKYGANGQNENKVQWNSGKAVGGSSILNGMIYNRGNKKDYDDWEEQGAKGWGYKNVLPYFLKLEDAKNMKDIDDDYHSVGGPMTVERPNYNPKIKRAALAALQGLGFQLTDSNGRRQTGIFDVQGSLRNQRRCSTVKAYLVPAEDRSNLDILKNAFVKKIIIQHGRAIGVEFDYRGRTITVRARREVVVSNGSTRTPQLLMLSGIGPKEHLEKFNISVVKDLPVGKNLHDHCGTYVNYLLNETTPVDQKLMNPKSWYDYLTHNSGPLTSTSQLLLIAFLSGLNITANTSDLPRQEIYFVEFSTANIEQDLNLKPEVYNQMYRSYEGKPMYSCLVSIMQPKSRGEITLNSTDPYDFPLINPNYYEEESDVKHCVEGIKVCEAVSRSKEMQKMGATRVPPIVPACEEYKNVEDQYEACYCKYVIASIWHPTGTSRMGGLNDSKSVVDPQLRVIGIEGLRVVNAAVMPIIVSGNTNVPTMMIAEKAYDMMKDDIQCDEEIP